MLKRSLRYCLLVCGLLLLAAPVLAAEKDESWDVIYLGDSRSGYVRSTTSNIQRNGKELIRTEVETHFAIKRFGQTLKMKILESFDETEDGELVGFLFRINNPPFTNMETAGARSGDHFHVTTTVAGRQTQRKVKCDPDAKSPVFQERLLDKDPLKPGETRTMKVFSPESLSYTEVELEAAGDETVELLDGQPATLLKIVSTMTLPGAGKISSSSYYDKQGNSLLSKVPIAGLTMTMYRVDKETALEKLAGAELDLGISTLVKVKPIKNAHETSRVVYQVTMPGENAADFIVAGETQTIDKTDNEESVKLTVTRAAIPRNSDGAAPAGDEFTRPTQLLQSDDPAVEKLARQAVGDERDEWKQAIRLEKFVHEKLTKKNFSTAMASAAEVAANLEGDCTEHAVLLAAMARAVGIPSRIAAGIVYVDRLSSFGGHMWTEVYIRGHWIPLDATLGAGGIGAGHIKLSQTSMADDAPTPVSALLPILTALAKIQIDPVDVEHEKPAP